MTPASFGVDASTALADWKDIALNGRRVYLAFDSDAASKPAVAGALEWLGEYFGRKADVRYCYLPDGPSGAKTGLDDYMRTRYPASTSGVSAVTPASLLSSGKES